MAGRVVAPSIRCQVSIANQRILQRPGRDHMTILQICIFAQTFAMDCRWAGKLPKILIFPPTC